MAPGIVKVQRMPLSPNYDLLRSPLPPGSRNGAQDGSQTARPDSEWSNKNIFSKYLALR